MLLLATNTGKAMLALRRTTSNSFVAHGKGLRAFVRTPTSFGRVRLETNPTSGRCSMESGWCTTTRSYCQHLGRIETQHEKALRLWRQRQSVKSEAAHHSQPSPSQPASPNPVQPTATTTTTTAQSATHTLLGTLEKAPPFALIVVGCGIAWALWSLDSALLRTSRKEILHLKRKTVHAYEDMEALLRQPENEGKTVDDLEKEWERASKLPIDHPQRRKATLDRVFAESCFGQRRSELASKRAETVSVSGKDKNGVERPGLADPCFGVRILMQHGLKIDKEQIDREYPGQKQIIGVSFKKHVAKKNENQQTTTSTDAKPGLEQWLEDNGFNVLMDIKLDLSVLEETMRRVMNGHVLRVAYYNLKRFWKED